MRAFFKQSVILYFFSFLYGVIPLAITPIYISFIGIDGYGKLNFLIVISQLLVVFADWGLSLTCQKEFILADEEFKSYIFWKTTFSKLLLAFVALFFLTAFYAFSQAFKLPFLVFLILHLLFSVLSSYWYFQAIQKLYIYLGFSILGRSLSYIFCLVVESQTLTFEIILATQAFPVVLSGLFGILYACQVGKLSFSKIPLSTIILEIKGSASLFGSIALISFYTHLTSLALGSLAGPYQLGLYSVAEKVKQVMQALYQPMASLLFPNVVKLSKETTVERHSFIKNISVVYLFLGLTSFIGCFLMAEEISILLTKNSNPEVTILIRVFSILPVFISFSNLFGLNLLVPLGYSNSFNRGILIAAIINITFIYFVVNSFKALGVAYLTVGIEIFVTYYFYKELKFKKVL